MRFAFCSPEGTTLSMWLRLIDEGHDVCVWIIPKNQQYVGEGLVDSVDSFNELVKWGTEEESVFVFDSSGQGDKAEALRKAGHLVVGGGKLCDRLEGDRDFGQTAARDCGMELPDSHQFSSISKTIEWVKKNPGEWVFKSNKYLESDTTYMGKSQTDLVRNLIDIRQTFGDNIPNIVQQKMQGIALSTSAWWGGRSFLEPFMGTIEHKSFMNGDVGPSTGCSFNLVWPYPGLAKIADALHFDKIAEFFRKENASVGIYDINALLAEDKTPYFLEWTPRFGYDSEPTSLKGLTEELGDTLYRLATGTLSEMPLRRDEAWMSVRLSVPPYAYEHVDNIKKSAYGTPIGGVDGLFEGRFVAYGVGQNDEKELIVADLGGLVGLLTAHGTDVKRMGKEILQAAEKLEIKGVQYRTDAADCIIEDLAEIKKLGFGPLEVTDDARNPGSSDAGGTLTRVG